MFGDDKFYRNVSQGNKKIGNKDDFMNKMKVQKKKDEDKKLCEQAAKRINEFLMKL